MTRKVAVEDVYPDLEVVKGRFGVKMGHWRHRTVGASGVRYSPGTIYYRQPSGPLTSSCPTPYSGSRFRTGGEEDTTDWGRSGVKGVARVDTLPFLS